ncbi:MAG: polysaccharide biosynthesis protein [Bacteroidales bacterium]|nr:polysaccharide biosynthesis protein [Candidatus Cacconaster merdequi]
MRKELSNALTHFFRNYVSTWVVFAFDTAISVMSSMVIVLVMDHLSHTTNYGGRFVLVWVLSSFFASLVMFLLTKSHRQAIRHTTLKDVFRLCLAIVGKILIMAGILQVSGVWYRNWIAVFLLFDLAVSVCALIAVRTVLVMAYRALQHNLRTGLNRVRVLIFGTSQKSVALGSRLVESKHYELVGFITPHVGRLKESLSLAGHPVMTFEDKSDVEYLINSYSVGAVLFATDTEVKQQQDFLVKIAVKSGIKVLISPVIDEVVGGHFMKSQIREISINDLLGREEIQVSMDRIVDKFNNSVVMVTGAAGSIGSELCRQIAGFGPKKLILFDNAETPMHNLRLELDETYPSLDYEPVIGDVRQTARLDYAFRRWHPQVVFHAAAYKHVPLMEENPCEAVMVNVCGSRNVADKCIEYGVERMVMISTDKAVNPTNIMGCSKRLAEIYVQSLGLAVSHGILKGSTRFVTTRFGNVLGSNGSVIPRFKEQIEKGGPVTVTHPEINRFFMTIPEACRLVMEAATTSDGNQIVVFDMGNPVKIVDLARRMIELSGLTPDKDIMIEFTGLRPGEKLYEEVLATEENSDATSHDRIRVAHVREYDFEEAKNAVAELERLASNVDIPALVDKMKELVPEYDCKWGGN